MLGTRLKLHGMLSFPPEMTCTTDLKCGRCKQPTLLWRLPLQRLVKHRSLSSVYLMLAVVDPP